MLGAVIFGGIALASLVLSGASSSSDYRKENNNNRNNSNHKNTNLRKQNNNLRRENQYYKQKYNQLLLTVNNHRDLLREFDYVNKFAQAHNFSGAVSFFRYLGKNHDKRFYYFADFMKQIKDMRNNVAHNGAMYRIDNKLLIKLDTCVYVCNRFQSLPRGRKLIAPK